MENQLKAIVPSNSDTNTIVYNERFVISDNPFRRVAWEVSKVESTTTFGLTKLTFTQELEHDPLDNISWVNFESDDYSDSKTGIEYDYYKARENDEDYHSTTDTYYIDESIISYTGVSPCMKVGGSFKKFTAKLYKNGNVIKTEPYWKIEYCNSDALICTIRLMYIDDRLVCDDSGEFIIEKNKITYSNNGEEIFGIQYRYDAESPMDIQIKCLPILSMINGSIIISAYDSRPEDSNTSASIKMEVEGL